jgi:site-specific DNA-methyltransferase (adenine-specific)
MQMRKRKDRQRTPGQLRPYYERAGIVLYHGESLQVTAQLESAIADAVITDPPYSSGGLTAADRAKDPVEKYCQNNKALGRPTFSGDMHDQRSFKFWATLWMIECRRLCKESGYGLVFTDWRQLPTMTDVLQAGDFVWRGVVPWNKGRGARAPHKGYFRHQCEYIVWGTNGRCRKAEHAGPFEGCITEPVRKTDKHHITGKPTNLMKQLVDVVPPGGLVVDLFGGSGTTAVACVLTGRRCILIEQSAGYCEIAAKRIDRAIDEQGLAAAA